MFRTTEGLDGRICPGKKDSMDKGGDGSITIFLKVSLAFRPPLQGYEKYLPESQGVALG
jgi:hypothetical protein